jgi:threonine dehydrogenase-like Zn-dependent dehydrogenase
LIESGVVRASDFVDSRATLDELPGLLKSMVSGNRAIKTLIEVHR